MATMEADRPTQMEGDDEHVKSPLARLTDEQIEELAREFDAVHDEVFAELGDRDRRYITSMIEMPFGCRMGICHTCTGRLCSGELRDLRTGEVHGTEGEMVRTCVNAPQGPVEIAL